VVELTPELLVDLLLENVYMVEAKPLKPGRLAPATWGNKKIPHNIAIVGSLPSGYTCPGAKDCMAKFDPNTRKIVDGPNILYRCYDASTEAIRPQVRAARWHNLEALRGKSREEMAAVIYKSLPTLARIIRIHEGGDFMSQAHFDAWMDVARKLPQVTFYTYTKSLPFWVKRLKTVPKNFKLTASRGGKHDDLIQKHGLKTAEVVMDPEEATAKGLPIDHDDSLAHSGDKDFALLIHGSQPKGSVASKAVQKLKKYAHMLRPSKDRTYGDMEEAQAVDPTDEMILLVADCDSPEDDDGVYDIYL
jgi:hypothetical protein